MKTRQDSLISTFVKGIALLITAFLIAFCLVAIAAGDGYMGLLEILRYE